MQAATAMMSKLSRSEGDQDVMIFYMPCDLCVSMQPGSIMGSVSLTYRSLSVIELLALGSHILGSHLLRTNRTLGLAKSSR
jgi:hypothetical protein